MSKSGVFNDSEISITGMACRFAGAEDLRAYWQLIKHNKIATCQNAPNSFPADHCRTQIPGGFVQGVDQFDAEFFGISNREALLMDPQQRLVLQHVWHAIEDAGIAPQSLRGSRTGVFVGAMANDWAARSIIDGDDFNSQMVTGNGLALIANRVSYLYDFKGPSISVDSACSSSLVAISYAVQALRNNDCDYAIVAGVNVIATQTLQHFYQRSGIASTKGQCQPFSRYSDGIVRGEGVGVLLLQRGGNRPNAYSLIKGYMLNHNGQSNGLSAPSRFAQQALLAQTYQKCGVTPDKIEYVECHGTGTELGDRIELQALNAVLNVPERKHACNIGSIKGLIGHTEAASGIAGTIKVALMLYHGYIPASLYADTPNTVLEKNTSLNLPPVGYPMEDNNHNLAAVSSFGLGGTNGHLVLQRASAPITKADPDNNPQLFVLSAPTIDALAEQARSLSDFLSHHPDCHFSALAAGSRRVKSLHKVKKTWVVSNAEGLNKKLRQFSLNPIVGETLNGTTSIYIAGNMDLPCHFDRALFNHFPVFRQAVERCNNFFYPLLGYSVISLMFENDGSLDAKQLNLWLPVLFTWHYAQAELWISEGVQAESFIGKDVGEYVAATMSGLLQLEEATYLLVQHAAMLNFQQIISDGDLQLETTAPYEKFQQYFNTIPKREAHTLFASCYHGTSTTLLPTFNAWLQLFNSNHLQAAEYERVFNTCDSSLILSNSATPIEHCTQVWLREDSTSSGSLQQHFQTLGMLFEYGAISALPQEQQSVGHNQLPAYCFQETRFWLKPIAEITASVQSLSSLASIPLNDPAPTEFVFNTLASILACEPETLKADLRLSEDLGLDSIIIIELIEILNKGLPEKHQLTFTDTLKIITIADLDKRVTTLMNSQDSTSKERV